MRQPNRTTVLANSLLITWATLCVLFFVLFAARVSHLQQFIFAGFAPFWKSLERIEPVSFLAALIGSLAGALIFAAACTGFGLFLLDIPGEHLPRPNSRSPRLLGWVATAFLVGQILLSLVFILLAVLGKMTVLTDSVALACMYLLGLRPSLRLYRSIRPTPEDKSEPWPSFYWILFSACLLLLASALLYSSARLSYDSTALYFSDEKLTALTGRLNFFPDDSFIVSSFHTGIQYAMVIQMFGDQAARLFSWVSGLCFIFLSVSLAGKMELSKLANLMLVALILTSTAFLDLMGDGKVDLLSSSFALAAVYWMVMGQDEPQGPLGIPAFTGLLMGFAFLARPYNLVLLGGFATIFYGQELVSGSTHLRDRIRSLGRTLAGVAAGAVALLVLHLWMNQIILGDFLAPLWNAAKSGAPQMWQWSFDTSDIWKFRALYLLVATYVNSPQSLGNISPLVLAFLPALGFGPIREQLALPRRAFRLWVMALAILLLWIWAYHMVEELRYVFFLWAVILVPVAELLASCVASDNKPISALTKTLIISLLLFLSARAGFVALATYSPVDDAGAPQCYDSSLCEFLRPLNDTAPPGSRVLGLSAYRYYLRPDLFVNSSKAEDYARMEQYSHGPAEQFWEQIYCQRYTYIAYENNYAVRHLNMDFKGLLNDSPPWMRLETLSQSKDNKQRAYAISWENVPGSVQQACTGQ